MEPIIPTCCQLPSWGQTSVPYLLMKNFPLWWNVLKHFFGCIYYDLESKELDKLAVTGKPCGYKFPVLPFYRSNNAMADGRPEVTGRFWGQSDLEPLAVKLPHLLWLNSSTKESWSPSRTIFIAMPTVVSAAPSMPCLTGLDDRGLDSRAQSLQSLEQEACPVKIQDGNKVWRKYWVLELQIKL